MIYSSKSELNRENIRIRKYAIIMPRPYEVRNWRLDTVSNLSLVCEVPSSISLLLINDQAPAYIYDWVP